MNPFMAAGSVLCFGAGVWSIYHGDWIMAVLYFCWAVGDAAAGLKG